ncbi:helix-turn-helix transcriptional regulator [Lysobacter terrae]
MRLEPIPLRPGAHFDAAIAREFPHDALHLFRLDSRGTSVCLPAGWWSLWIVLHGELQLESASGAWRLRAGLLIANEGRLRATCVAPTLTLALAGPPALWRELLARQGAASELLVRQGACPKPLRRMLVRLARALRDGAEIDGNDGLVAALGRCLIEQQRDLLELATRCSGRTPQRRLQTLQRLLRVHQLIERGNDPRLDLARLAREASYSPWHLIRMYHDVFAETPSEHVARLRLARAWSLVRESTLPVCEITHTLGFESQSAFCRAFKSAYGLTTTQVRHLPAGGQLTPRPAHARPRQRRAPKRQSVLPR